MDTNAGMLYLKANFKDWDQILSQIDPSLLYINEEEQFGGYNYDPYFFLLKNIDNSISDSEIDKLVEQINPFKIALSQISTLSFPDSPFEALKIDIQLNPVLEKYRELCVNSLPHTIDVQKFHPYILISYMKKNTSKEYNTPFTAKPIVEVNTLFFTDHKNRTYKYQL